MLVGDSADNQLLGRPGPDSYFAAGGNDSILANSGVPPKDANPDPDPTIDCGDGFDTAQIDYPRERPRRRSDRLRGGRGTRPEQLPPARTRRLTPIPEPAAAPHARPTDLPVEPQPRRPRDRESAGHQAPPPTGQGSSSPPTASRRQLRLRRDRARRDLPLQARPRAPSGPAAHRASTASRRDRHTFRVFAIDRAGNRDRTPALFKIRVRRR